jgi:GT2 family glycosyltransferase
VTIQDHRPRVSIVLVNYKGADDTIEALHHLKDVDWPSDRLQLIVVDNDSQDGSEDAIRAAAPFAEVHQAGANTGFAGGCNFGVSRADGEYVGFINSDAKPHPQWIAEAVQAMAADGRIGCVASKVLSWDGQEVDYVDGGLTWFGMAYKLEAGRPDSADYDQPRDVLFGTGAAMFVRTDLFRAVGGFDERFFMFFEDVDLGWRLNLLGHKVRYIPTSIAYHRHHQSIKKFGQFRETFLLERNALMCLYKNLGDELLRTALGGTLIASLRRANAQAEQTKVEMAGGASRLAIGRGDLGTEAAETGELKDRLTSAYAMDDFLRHLPALQQDRRELQDRRRRSDREILPLFRDPLLPVTPLAHYLAVYYSLKDLLGVPQVFHAPRKVIVVTGDMISDKMAGPAIRAWETAKTLAEVCEVRLISITAAQIHRGPGFGVFYGHRDKLREHIDWCDVLVFQGHLLFQNQWIAGTDKIIVTDIYDPIHLEQLEQARDLGETERAAVVGAQTAVLNQQIGRADLLLCASDKQKAFWLGQCAVLGRNNRAIARQYGRFEDFIKVVPFGLGDSKPVQRRHGLRGVIPGIGPDDKVIIWGGGVYSWFDPLTLVRAVALLAPDHPNIRLFFMGLKHPNPGVPEMSIATELRQLSDSLNLTDRHVFFNKGWVPYEDRADVLLDADVGVSTHFEHIETAYSFRTRILDYLWAGLPIVATTGDSFGNVLDQEGIGIGVPPEDVDALAIALATLLYDETAAAKARTEVARFADQFRWSRVLEPLVEFCSQPSRAADLALGAGMPVPVPLQNYKVGLKRDLQLARDYFRAGGPKLLATRVTGRMWKAVSARKGG